MRFVTQIFVLGSAISSVSGSFPVTFAGGGSQALGRTAVGVGGSASGVGGGIGGIGSGMGGGVGSGVASGPSGGWIPKNRSGGPAELDANVNRGNTGSGGGSVAPRASPSLENAALHTPTRNLETSAKPNPNIRSEAAFSGSNQPFREAGATSLQGWEQSSRILRAQSSNQTRANLVDAEVGKRSRQLQELGVAGSDMISRNQEFGQARPIRTSEQIGSGIPSQIEQIEESSTGQNVDFMPDTAATANQFPVGGVKADDVREGVEGDEDATGILGREQPGVQDVQPQGQFGSQGFQDADELGSTGQDSQGSNKDNFGQPMRFFSAPAVFVIGRSFAPYSSPRFIVPDSTGQYPLFLF